jgi:glucose/mannose-6-phosphate isomerase
LDDIGHVKQLDKSGMLGLLLDFPEQIRRAVDITNSQSMRPEKAYSSIVFTGLGGSAIGGDVVKCCFADELDIPFVVNRDYFVPAFVNAKTLVFASSYSGNTEETLSAYKDAKRKKARIIVITSGGELARLARKDGYPLITIPQGMPPRCALGYSFVPVLIAISRLGFAGNKEEEIDEAVNTIIDLRDNVVGPLVRSRANPAKRMASALAGRFCAVYGWSKTLDCAATRWRNQFCENSKTLASSHFLPEMNHNEIMGFNHPKRLLKDTVVIFLRDKDEFRRVSDRIEITRSIIKNRVHRVFEVDSKGSGLVSRICSLIYIGDFVSFYLAILNGEDPTPVDEITYLKKELARKKI